MEEYLKVLVGTIVMHLEKVSPKGLKNERRVKEKGSQSHKAISNVIPSRVSNASHLLRKNILFS